MRWRDKTEQGARIAGKNSGAKSRKSGYKSVAEGKSREHQNRQTVVGRLPFAPHLAMHSASHSFAGSGGAEGVSGGMMVMWKAAEAIAAGHAGAGAQRPRQQGKRRGQNRKNQDDGVNAAHRRKTSIKSAGLQKFQKTGGELPGEILRDSLVACCHSS